MVKIRLTRTGRHGLALYRIVVADSRAPRDGRFIDQIGHFNPNTNPATIVINESAALEWLSKGAQPTDSVKSILSSQGIIAKHRNKG